MTASPDDPDPSGAAPTPAGAPHTAPQGAFRVCVIDADDAWRALLEQWLQALGCEVVAEADDSPAPAVDLVIVDLPFPRQGGVDLLKRITSRHPATPIVALSSNFFSRIECCGPLARDLGVACVLPKPATRDAIAAAVRRVLPV